MDLSSTNRREEENFVEDFTVEDTRMILNVLTREQLIELVQESATKHRYVRDQVRSTAVKNNLLRRLFVRGLGLETNAQSLRAIFSPFGELNECIVKMDNKTRKSKGYGFVTFKHFNDALKALKEPSKTIDGLVTVTQFASAKDHPSQPQADLNERKIYVGNVPVEMEAGHLLTLFSQYGEIEEGPLGFDKQSGRWNGYAIFIYKTVEAAKRALEEPLKTIDDGHVLSCKLANIRRMPTPNRVNSLTTTNGFGNPVSGVNQSRNPSGVTAQQGWSEQNYNGNNVVYHMNQIPSLYLYGVPEGYLYTDGVQPSSGFAEGSRYPYFPDQSQYQE